MRTSLLLIAAVALAFTVIPGCGKKIKHKKLEKNIAKTLKEKTGKAPKSVTCPKDVKEKKGKIFYCKAVGPDDKTYKVEVKMLGDGKVKWQMMANDAPAGPPGGAKLPPAGAPKPEVAPAVPAPATP